MGLVWNGTGAYGLAAAALAWALAVAVYRLRPDRSQNQVFAVALVFEGLYIFGGLGFIYFLDDPDAVYALQIVWAFAIPGFIASYLALLGTLRTPLSAPWRHRWGLVGLRAALLATWAVIAFRPRTFVTGVARVEYAAYDAILGPGSQWMVTVANAVMVYGLFVALSTWRRAAAGTSARNQAFFFLLAFGVRDVLYFLITFGSVTEVLFGSRVTLLHSIVVGDVRFHWAGTTVILFVLLAAYGIFKAQLFDIDLRIKHTLRRGTLAAFYLAAFLVVTQLAQNFLSLRFGWVYGGLATGLLLFAAVPLQRLAERVAHAAMPHVAATEAYLTYRKIEVYKEALEGLLEDGDISTKERRVLERLQKKLGIASSDANALESDVRQAFSASDT